VPGRRHSCESISLIVWGTITARLAYTIYRHKTCKGPITETFDSIGQQMYCGDSVVGKASTIGIKISSIPPRIFTRVKKCEIWRRFQHHSTLSGPRLKMSKISELWNKISCVGMIALWWCQVWWSWLHATPKIVRRKRANSSITQPWIIRFRLNFVQTLITWRLMYHKLSRLTAGQRSRSQRDITYQHKTL